MLLQKRLAPEFRTRHQANPGPLATNTHQPTMAAASYFLQLQWPFSQASAQPSPTLTPLPVNPEGWEQK